jgi:hypothetical protein
MMVLLLMANYASYSPKIHLSQLFRFLEPLLADMKITAAKIHHSWFLFEGQNKPFYGFYVGIDVVRRVRART